MEKTIYFTRRNVLILALLLSLELAFLLSISHNVRKQRAIADDFSGHNVNITEIFIS